MMKIIYDRKNNKLKLLFYSVSYFLFYTFKLHIQPFMNSIENWSQYETMKVKPFVHNIWLKYFYLTMSTAD